MDNMAPWFVLFEQMNDNETKKIFGQIYFEVKKSLNVKIKRASYQRYLRGPPC